MRRGVSVPEVQALQPQVASATDISAPAWALLVRHLEAKLDEERAATARVLHDELGGFLVAAKMDLGDLQRSLAGREQQVLERAQRAQEDLELAIATERRLVEALRPGLLVHVGLIAAVRGYLQWRGGGGTALVRGILPDEEADLPLQRRTALYQAVKEAVEYASEHATEAVTLTIALEPDSITVRLAPFSAPQRAALDPRLLAITHRLHSVEGTMEIPQGVPDRSELVMVVSRLGAKES